MPDNPDAFIDPLTVSRRSALSIATAVPLPVASAMDADAENRSRFIECQIRQATARSCLLELGKGGVLSFE